ncbi:hypothetical protein MMC31_002752 [Peltigera leucophlebia]|nr:hypothetical protein [Peltigera leucophlebia]
MENRIGPSSSLTYSSRAPSSTKSTSKPPRKSANLLGNSGFKLRDPKNPLAGTVVDDILPRVDDQHGGIRERKRREEDIDKENDTISLDDDDILDQPDLPFTVQWSIIFLFNPEESKQIGKDAQLFSYSGSFNYEKWRRNQSELVNKYCTRRCYAKYAGPVRVLLKSSDHKHKQDMNCNTPEDWNKAIEMLLYWHKDLRRKALSADISWAWERNEPENSSSEGENSEMEKSGQKPEPKRHARHTPSIYLNGTNMLSI